MLENFKTLSFCYDLENTSKPKYISYIFNHQTISWSSNNNILSGRRCPNLIWS